MKHKSTMVSRDAYLGGKRKKSKNMVIAKIQDNRINFGGWEVVVLWKEKSSGTLGGCRCRFLTQYYMGVFM